MSKWQSVDLSKHQGGAEENEEDEVVVEFEDGDVQGVEDEDISFVDEEDTSEENIEEEVDEEDEFEYDDDEEDDVEEDSATQNNSEKDEKLEKRKSRSQERIRQLANERRLEKEARIKAEKELFALRKTQIERDKETNKAQKEYLTRLTGNLKEQIKKAYEADDHSLAVDLQEQLSEAKATLHSLNTWKPEEIGEFDESKYNTPSKDDIFLNAPEPMQEWLENNSWFTNPSTPAEKAKVQVAVNISNELLAKGLEDSSEEFYEQIDRILEKKGLASSTRTKVQSNKVKNSSRRKTLKPSSGKKIVSQKVQGASRTTAKSSNKNKVLLTTEEKKLADLYGMTYAEYAKEKLRIEKANANGERNYVEI